MLNALSSGSSFTNATPLAAAGTSSKSGGLDASRQLTHTSALAHNARRTNREMTIMPQDSLWKTVSLAAVLLLAVACRAKPADQQDPIAAHYRGLEDLERGRLVEAEASFKTVVAQMPNDPVGFANLGLTYLRGGRYAEAESQLSRARRLDPANVEVGLIAAKLYGLTGRPADARRILEGLPRDAKVQYALAQLGEGGPTVGGLRTVLDLAPGNLVVRLQLVDLLVRAGEADSAARHLEDVRRLRPAPPREAQPQLDATIRYLRAGNLTSARGSLDRFLGLITLTVPYQAALSDVAWTEGPLVGRPVVEFNPQSLIATHRLRVGRQADVHFTDATDDAGLPAQA